MVAIARSRSKSPPRRGRGSSSSSPADSPRTEYLGNNYGGDDNEDEVKTTYDLTPTGIGIVMVMLLAVAVPLFCVKAADPKIDHMMHNWLSEDGKLVPASEVSAIKVSLGVAIQANEELKGRLATTTKEKGDLELALNEVTKARDAAAAAERSATAQLETALATVKAKEKEAADSKTAYNSEKLLRDATETKLQAALKDKKDLEYKVTTLEANIKQLTAELMETKSQLAAANKGLSTSEAEVKRLKTLVDSLQAQVKTLEGKLSDAVAAKQQAEDNATEAVNKANAEAKQKVEEAEKQKAISLASVKKLTNQVAEVAGDIKTKADETVRLTDAVDGYLLANPASWLFG